MYFFSTLNGQMMKLTLIREDTKVDIIACFSSLLLQVRMWLGWEHVSLSTPRAPLVSLPAVLERSGPASSGRTRRFSDPASEKQRGDFDVICEQIYIRKHLPDF